MTARVFTAWTRELGPRRLGAVWLGVSLLWLLTACAGMTPSSRPGPGDDQPDSVSTVRMGQAPATTDTTGGDTTGNATPGMNTGGMGAAGMDSTRNGTPGMNTGGMTSTTSDSTTPPDTSATSPADTTLGVPLREAAQLDTSTAPTDPGSARAGVLPPTGVSADSAAQAAMRERLSRLQPPPGADSLAVLDRQRLNPGMFVADSLADDSLAADSALADTAREEGDIDTTFAYGADAIYFDVPKRRSTLEGRAWFNYKGMKLNAHRIEVEWNRDLMTATPGYDTTWTDSSRAVIDSITVVGKPTFSDGQQDLEGMLMKVNLKTKEGYLEKADTEHEIGFYHGNQIQKVSDDVLFVKDGYFTTSQEDPPDYKFTGNEMKMEWGEKVVGRPVVLRFGDVPAFALPFAVFSLKRGRRSGIHIPTYGDDSRNGRFLSDFGYYWAASEYWDLDTRLDFYERTGIIMRSKLTYNVRDGFNGDVGGSFNNRSGGSPRWSVDARHSQQFGPNTRLNVDGEFVSDGDYYGDVSNNVSQRLDQRIYSKANFSHNWRESGSSINIGLRHNQDLATDENSQTLPSARYQMGRWYPFPSEREKKKRADNDLLYEPPAERLTPAERRAARQNRDNEDHWYNNITVAYNNRLENERDESLQRDPETGEEVLHEEWSSGLQHTARVSATNKVAKYFNITPSVNYIEDWMLERRHWQLDGDGDPYDTQERGFFQRRRFSASTSLNTKLYGYFPVNRWTVQTVRHVVTPSVSVSYQPDFSDPEFGYYQNLEATLPDTTIADGDTTVSMVTYKETLDRYRGTVFGGTPRGKQLSLNLSLDNLLQMKRVTFNEEGEEEESKLDLFTYNLSSGINFAADSLQLRDLSASFRANPISGKTKLGPLERLSIQLNTRHSFYQYDTEANRQVDKFYWDRDDRSGLNLLRMTSFSATANFSLTGASPFARQRAQAEEQAESDTLAADEQDEQFDEYGFENLDRRDRFSRSNSSFDGMKGNTPWRVSGNLRYNLSMTNPMQPRETLQVGGTFSVKLTERWDIQYTTRVDLISRDVVTSSFQVKRDLKSWEGSLSWSPQGISSGFYVRIGIKAPMLQDVQIESQRNGGGFNPSSLY